MGNRCHGGKGNRKTGETKEHKIHRSKVPFKDFGVGGRVMCGFSQDALAYQGTRRKRHRVGGT